MTRMRAIVLVVAVFTLFPAVSAAQQAAAAPDRGGFTLLVNMGVGRQDDGALPEAKTGLAGINLGIGGFLSDDLVLWFRASGTTADYDVFNQTSGVGAPALQYWVNERFNIEGGVGLGFWDIDGTNETGLGLFLGTGFTIYNSGRHNLQIGLEYAGAFTDPETVHNFGLTFGYQLL